MQKDLIDIIGVVGAITLPLFNIPLVIKIIQRRSSQDLSLIWVAGVWFCLLLMLPSGLRTDDIVLRAFSFANISLFSIVACIVFKYRLGPQNERKN